MVKKSTAGHIQFGNIIVQVSGLNSLHFGEKDIYSDAITLGRDIESGKVELIIELGGEIDTLTGTNSYDIVVEGYAIFHCTPEFLECIRRGVRTKGKGLGLTLTKRLIKIADSRGLIFFTYAHRDNLASINSNIRAGCVITKMPSKSSPWVYMQNRR